MNNIDNVIKKNKMSDISVINLRKICGIKKIKGYLRLKKKDVLDIFNRIYVVIKI